MGIDVYLLQEDGELLLQEDTCEIILEELPEDSGETCVASINKEKIRAK